MPEEDLRKLLNFVSAEGGVYETDVAAELGKMFVNYLHNATNSNFIRMDHRGRFVITRKGLNYLSPETFEPEDESPISSGTI